MFQGVSESCASEGGNLYNEIWVQRPTILFRRLVRTRYKFHLTLCSERLVIVRGFALFREENQVRTRAWATTIAKYAANGVGIRACARRMAHARVCAGWESLRGIWQSENGCAAKRDACDTASGRVGRT